MDGRTYGPKRGRRLKPGGAATLAVCVAALALAGAVAPANAARIQSISSGVNFTAVGPLTLQKGLVNVTCSASLLGTIDNIAGTAVITGGSLSGGPGGLCSSITVTPGTGVWTAPTLTTVNIASVSLSGSGFLCGPNPASGTWGAPVLTLPTTTLTGTPPPNCFVSGSLTLSNFQIVP